MFFEIYRFLIKTRDSESTTHNLTSQGINSWNFETKSKVLLHLTGIVS
jgi:hypothetical protein